MKKIIAKLCNPNVDHVKIAKSLLGIIPPDITLEEAITERTRTV